MIVLRELSKFFENEPGKMEIFITELSNIQLKELHKKQTSILDEITQNQKISYAQTPDFLLDQKGIIDTKKLNIEFFDYIHTLPEPRIGDKLWEDITINEFSQLNGIPENFKQLLQIQLDTQKVVAIKEKAQEVSIVVTDNTLTEQEAEEKIQTIVQEYSKNNKYISLSDIVEQIEEEEKAAIIENEVSENKTITEENN